MRTRHKFKIHQDGDFIAQCVDAETASAIVANIGGTVTYDGGNSRLVVWREGSETVSASQSYDEAAAVMHARILRKWPTATL